MRDRGGHQTWVPDRLKRNEADPIGEVVGKVRDRLEVNEELHRAGGAPCLAIARM